MNRTHHAASAKIRTPRTFKSILAGMAAGLAAIIAAPQAMAQVGPSAAIRPWASESHWAESEDTLTFIDHGHTKVSDRGVRIFHWDSEGRIKFNPENPDPDFALGYRVLTIDIESGHPALPGGQTDISMAGIFKLRNDEEYRVSLIAGAGSATDNHFRNGEAVYAVGTLNVTKKVDALSAWHAGINYHGNRSFMPDIPLPYLMWTQVVSRELDFRLGLPASGFRFQSLEPLTLEADYVFPYNVSGRATWAISPTVSFFGEYSRSVDGFHIDDEDSDRLFYDSSKASAGVRWINKWLDIRMGAGYAFEQDFSRGWDVRDADTVVDLSDEPFFFFKISGNF